MWVERCEPLSPGFLPGYPKNARKSESVKEKKSIKTTTYIYIYVYIYIYMAKASFSAHVFGKNAKIGEIAFFRPKKPDRFWSSLLFLHFSPFCLKMAKIWSFCLSKRQKVGRKRGLCHIYIYIYAVKLLTGPRFAILIVTNWATLIVTNWATSFSHYKNRGFR